MHDRDDRDDRDDTDGMDQIPIQTKFHVVSKTPRPRTATIAQRARGTLGHVHIRSTSMHPCSGTHARPAERGTGPPFVEYRIDRVDRVDRPRPGHPVDHIHALDVPLRSPDGWQQQRRPLSSVSSRPLASSRHRTVRHSQVEDIHRPSPPGSPIQPTRLPDSPHPPAHRPQSRY